MKNNNNKNNVKKYKKYNPYLFMRAERNEKDASYKTTVLVNPKLLPEATLGPLHQKLNKIPGHRPVATVGSPENSPEKRPKYVYTPNGTKLEREKDYGRKMCLIYSNKKIQEVERPEPNLANDELAKVLQTSGKEPLKHREIVITPELLENTARECQIAKRGTHGIPDQNQCMVKEGINKQEASATKISQRLGLWEQNEIWEWLHLIAYMIQGRVSQNKENIVGGTKHANTDMMFAEDVIPYLVSTLGHEVKLQVTADEIPGTHFAREIKYNIIHKDIVLQFVFNAQTSIQPSLRNKDYIHTIVETILEQTTLLLNSKQTKKRLDFDLEASAPGKQHEVTEIPDAQSAAPFTLTSLA